MKAFDRGRVSEAFVVWRPAPMQRPFHSLCHCAALLLDINPSSTDFHGPHGRGRSFLENRRPPIVGS